MVASHSKLESFENDRVATRQIGHDIIELMSPSPGAPIAPPVAAGKSILAIDYGRRRMGLALSDSLGMTARPLPYACVPIAARI